MHEFLAKHANAVIGTISGFDRLLLRGTLLQMARPAGVMSYLAVVRVLLKDFAAHAEALTEQLTAASKELAQRLGRPYRYLAAGGDSKEEMAREIARGDGIEHGLICIFAATEPCLSYTVAGDRASKRLRLVPRQRRCLHLYHYHMHPVFGFMHARIQTWFPFPIQVCLNGREWLARTMDVAGLQYVQRDNCFTWLQDADRAQQLMHQQVRAAWPELLNAVAHGLNPQHAAMMHPCRIPYYWTIAQCEWATDIMFRDRQSLAQLHPRLVRHGLTTFLSPDVLRFLGRKTPPRGSIPSRLRSEVTSDVKRRTEGVRIKHPLGENSIKMYDKQGTVLRVETTTNSVEGFKTFRAADDKPGAAPRWQRMRKGVADLHRRTEVSQAANERYLRTLASVENATPLGDLAHRLCQPVSRNGRRSRALNPYAPDDARLLEAISRGEFAINGFRNRDLRHWLFADAGADKQVQRRHAAAVSRKLALLRAHGLVIKVQGTHRYHLSRQGRIAVTALISARNVGTEELTKMAA